MTELIIQKRLQQVGASEVQNSSTREEEIDLNTTFGPKHRQTHSVLQQHKNTLNQISSITIYNLYRSGYKFYLYFL